MRPRHAVVWTIVAHAALLTCLLFGATSEASAQIDATYAGLSSNGLCGLSLTSFPTCPRRVGVSVTGGYGYTESIGPIEGAHHRASGLLGAGITPLPWLSVALRLDGRLDFHPRDADGKDLTGTGDPRLFLRAGRVVSKTVSLGGEVVLWFPGRDAPSFRADATSVDLKALVAWTARSVPVSVLGHVGYRLDQSENSAPDVSRLRYGDRIALGLSDFDAVLLALGVTTLVGPRTDPRTGKAPTHHEVFAELALDWLIGSAAPSFSKSPLRGTVGARHFFSRSLQGELSATVAVQGRPSVEAAAALVPIDPRFLLQVGLRYGFDPYVPPTRPTEDTKLPARDEPVDALPTTAAVTGRLVDDNGAPLPDVRVALTSEDPTNPPLETVTDGEGTYSFAAAPVGPASIEASAPGFETLRFPIDVQPKMAPAEQRPLARKGNLGTLRLLTRTFSSEPLASAIVIRDVRGKKVAGGTADAQGLFEFDLPPGRYVVMISAAGYRPHRREVQIERHGVAILNVDMREQK